MAHGAVARGGLVAAGRITRGEPAFFDFLSQLSTIVQDAQGARSFDLIAPDEVLPVDAVWDFPESAEVEFPTSAVPAISRLQ